MANVAPSSRRLSISNLAWPPDADEEALDFVARLGFEGIELAPSRVFGDFAAVSAGEVRAYRRRAEHRGLVISALHGILFGVQGAHLFERPAARRRMADHLRRVAEIAGELGARACVFGSPTLRDPGDLPVGEALEIAQAFFRSLSGDYACRNVELCFEANPPLYGCRFVTRTHEAFNLVESVDLPGIAMQLDTGTMFINGEDPDIIGRVESRVGHFHVSEPSLVPTGTGGVDHRPVAAALRASSYPHWISIEMKAADDWRGAVWQAYAIVESTYRGAHGSA